MNRNPSSIIGKTIRGVVIKASSHYSRAQLFLLFSNNSDDAFYCYTDVITHTKGISLSNIETVLTYMSQGMTIVFEKPDL